MWSTALVYSEQQERKDLYLRCGCLPDTFVAPERTTLLYVSPSLSPHPPLYLLTHAVSFLPLATRYTCYSDSVNTPRCSPYSTDTVTWTSAARTSTLTFVGLHPTGISGYGDGTADDDFGDSLPDDSGSNLNGLNLNGSNSNGSNLSPPAAIGGVKERFFELRPSPFPGLTGACVW